MKAQWIWGVVGLAACSEEQSPKDSTVEPQAVEQRYTLPGKAKADFLFVVDNSGSMCQEQHSLARSFPELADGLAERMDVRIAVTSTDMQTAGHRGAFQNTPAAPEPSLNCKDEVGDPIVPDTADCPADLPAILVADDVGDPEDLERRFRCMVTLGTQGDGFEKGLEAMRQALSCQGPNRDHFAECCRADGTFDPTCTTAEFLRPDAALFVVFLSDEPDCSDDPANPVSRDANSNCEWQRDRLVPVEDYYRFLVGLKAEPLESIVVAAIVGRRSFTEAGNEVSYLPGEPSPECAGDPDRGDPPPANEACCPGGACVGEIQPTCASSSGVAFSGRRYLELTERFGHNGVGCPADADQNDPNVCTSICMDDYSEATSTLNNQFVHVVNAWCLDFAPQPDTLEIETDHRLIADEFTLNLNEPACPSGASVMLDETPAPGSEVVIRYLPR